MIIADRKKAIFIHVEKSGTTVEAKMPGTARDWRQT